MFSSTSLRGLLVVGGIALVCAPCPADIGLDGLIRNSPFADINARGKNAAGDDQPLEFRGFVCEDSGAIYSIYETATHRSFWLRENQEMDQFTVRHFDAAAATIVVDYMGHSLNLVLKKAAVALAKPGPQVHETPMPEPAQTADALPLPILSNTDRLAVLGRQAQIKAFRERRPAASPGQH